MKKTQEKGVTLVALVITIIVLLIISGIGITAGNGAADYAKFYNLKSEFKLLQTKVNELSSANKNTADDVEIIGRKLNETEILKLNEITEITDVIYANKTNEEQLAIQNSFEYCDIGDIQEKLGLKVNRDYVISVKYRYIIFLDGLEYKDVTYYISNQIEEGIYNIEHVDKNSTAGTFSIKEPERDGDRWKIEIYNIQYNGYIKNWQVQYRFASDEEVVWKNANGLIFYLVNEGNYYVRLVNGDIVLGPSLVSIIEE